MMSVGALLKSDLELIVLFSTEGEQFDVSSLNMIENTNLW